MHGFLTFLFLINGYWLALVLNLPLLAWNVKKYVEPASNPTEPANLPANPNNHTWVDAGQRTNGN